MQGWIILNRELGLPRYDERSKIFFDKVAAQRYCHKVNSDPEVRKHLSTPSIPYICVETVIESGEDTDLGTEIVRLLFKKVLEKMNNPMLPP